MCLSRIVSKIDGNFCPKSQNFPTRLYFAPPLKQFPLELSIGAGGTKTKSDGATRRNGKFHDIFSHLDTIHQRDRTDIQTPGNSKDHAYA